MISLTAALETCEYELICITLHIDEEKSTDTIERFNVFFLISCTHSVAEIGMQDKATFSCSCKLQRWLTTVGEK